MSEAGMRKNLVKALVSLDAKSIESPSTGIGIPDVNYVGGWIECKWMKDWPARADTQNVTFSHPLSVEQGIWAWRRERAGGVSLVCAQVARSWFFYRGISAKDIFGKMTRPEMIFNADFYSPNGLEKERLISWLRSL